MAGFIKTILVIIFIPVFTIAVIATSVKYQLLSPKFWKNTLSQNNVYKDIAATVKTLADSKTIKGGGNPRDIKILTDVVTPELTQDFMEKNITNILDYANGKRKDLIAYIPISKIPKNLAPKSVGLNQEEIPFDSLLAKFNIGQNALPLTQIAYFGKAVNYVLVFSYAVSLVIAILLFVLTEKGSRFFSFALALTLSGILIAAIVRLLNFAHQNFLSNPVTDSHFGISILKILGPLVLSELLMVWNVVGITAIVVGLIFMFIKKPGATPDHV